jgi:hypothetical protein
MEETADAYRYRYAISVRNADANDHECSLMFDRSELKRFLLEAPASPFTVKGGESRTVDVVLSIPKKAAVDLPSLYTESIPFVLKVQGLEESDVPVLRGWQDLPLFATVPPRYAGNGRPRVRCDANRLIQLGAWVKTDAAFSNAFAWFRAAADSALRRPAAVPKEKGVFLGDRQNADDAFYCALVYALTGETRYRARARDTLLTYAAIPPLKPRTGGNATGYANVMGGSLLEEAYAKGLPWAYDFLMASGGLSKSESQKIEEDLLLPMLKSMGRHHTGYTAQTSEYISQELACALVCGHWSMAGRALHGDFGFYDMLDNAFDAAGWTRENNLALNVIQGMTVTPMILMAESADGVGINAFGNSKFQTILKNAGMGSFPPTGPSGPGPNTTLRPCPMSSYPESQSWFFGHPRP